MPQNHFACQRMAEIRRFSFLCKILNSTGRLCLLYGYIFVGKYDIQLLSAFQSNLKSKVEGTFNKLWLASWPFYLGLPKLGQKWDFFIKVRTFSI